MIGEISASDGGISGATEETFGKLPGFTVGKPGITGESTGEVSGITDGEAETVGEMIGEISGSKDGMPGDIGDMTGEITGPHDGAPMTFDGFWVDTTEGKADGLSRQVQQVHCTMAQSTISIAFPQIELGIGPVMSVFPISIIVRPS